MLVLHSLWTAGQSLCWLGKLSKCYNYANISRRTRLVDMILTLSTTLSRFRQYKVTTESLIGFLKLSHHLSEPWHIEFLPPFLPTTLTWISAELVFHSWERFFPNADTVRICGAGWSWFSNRDYGFLFKNDVKYLFETVTLAHYHITVITRINRMPKFGGIT